MKELEEIKVIRTKWDEFCCKWNLEFETTEYYGEFLDALVEQETTLIATKQREAKEDVIREIERPLKAIHELAHGKCISYVNLRSELRRYLKEITKLNSLK